MKLEGDYTFEAPIRHVWSALFDPEVLAAILPGCEKLEREGSRYTGELTIKVGPVQGTFSGKVDIKDVDELKGYSLTIDGKGPTGFVRATAKLALRSEGDRTKLRYEADAQVGGKIASVGQRLMDATAKAIAKQALEGLHANVKLRAEHAEEEKPHVEEKKEEVHEQEEREEAEQEEEEQDEEEQEDEQEEAEEEEPESEKPARRPAPVVKTSQAAFAAGVAKEVGKNLIPPQALWIVALGFLAFVIWMLFHG